MCAIYLLIMKTFKKSTESPYASEKKTFFVSHKSKVNRKKTDVLKVEKLRANYMQAKARGERS